MKKLMKGNEAISEAAIQAGCRYFFGYPITPQNEVPAYMSLHLPKHGGVYLQAESEVSAINMVYGAAGSGARVMTSSSSPGISLKQEGISYIAGAELPCLIVNIQRSGPGLGGILPAQGDYFQAVKGGGHGDFKMPVYAPSTVQEAVSLTMEAFDVADMYRTPVMLLGDGILGQMMEPVEFVPPKKRDLPAKDWATTGNDGSRPNNVINSLVIEAEPLYKKTLRMYAKYDEIAKNETKFELYKTDDAELIVTSFGSSARIAKSVVDALREEGYKIGLIRPITLWPFPTDVIAEYASKDSVKHFLTVEMNMGQMVEDVRLAVNGKKPVEFFGRCGGVIPTFDEIKGKIMEMIQEVQ